MESHFQALALAAYHRQSFDPDWFEDWLGVVWMPGSVVRDQRVRDLAARYGLEINLCNEYAAECAGVIGQPLPVSMAITNSWIRRPVKKNKLPHGTVYVITDAALEAVVEDAINSALAGPLGDEKKPKPTAMRRRMKLFDANDILETVSIHYLRRSGGGRLTVDKAIVEFAGWSGMNPGAIDERTLRYRLDQLRGFNVVAPRGGNHSML